MEKKEIIVVSFGTTNPQARRDAIGGIEDAVRAAYPDCAVVRCFTSPRVRQRIEREEQIHIFDPEEAFADAAEKGVEILRVVPTHLMDGIEMKKFRAIFAHWKEKFSDARMAGPLLGSDADLDATLSAVWAYTSDYLDGQTNILLAGHGTPDSANEIYHRIEEQMEQRSPGHYPVATIEGTPSITDAIEKLKKRDVKRVVILPVLIVSGEHVLHDISGEQEDSWVSQLADAGYETEVIRHGLGEVPEIQQIFVEHVKNLV